MCLDENKRMLNHEDWRVRIELARKGLFLDKLVNDESWEVRVAVAKQNYESEKLSKDESPYVRAAVYLTSGIFCQDMKTEIGEPKTVEDYECRYYHWK